VIFTKNSGIRFFESFFLKKSQILTTIHFLIFPKGYKSYLYIK